MADDDSGDHWDGFSIYAEVSRDIHSSVGQAIDSYSAIVAAHSEGAKVRPDEAAQHKAAILSAAHRLLTEMEVEVERGSTNKNEYESILDNWRGDDNEDGWIGKLHGTNLSSEYPGWLHDFVPSIHRAAWHLGYLKAGRRESEATDTPEASGRAMLEDIAQNGAPESNA